MKHGTLKNMKKIKGQYRQGDVLIQRVAKAKLGEFATEKHDRVILAHGEATGHHHSVVDCEDGIANGERVIIPRGVTPAVEHQEHSRIALRPGRAHIVRRQTAYTPGPIRNVAD